MFVNTTNHLGANSTNFANLTAACPAEQQQSLHSSVCDTVKDTQAILQFVCDAQKAEEAAKNIGLVEGMKEKCVGAEYSRAFTNSSSPILQNIAACQQAASIPAFCNKCVKGIEAGKALVKNFTDQARKRGSRRKSNRAR